MLLLASRVVFIIHVYEQALLIWEIRQISFYIKVPKDPSGHRRSETIYLSMFKTPGIPTSMMWIWPCYIREYMLIRFYMSFYTFVCEKKMIVWEGRFLCVLFLFASFSQNKNKLFMYILWFTLACYFCSLLGAEGPRCKPHFNMPSATRGTMIIFELLKFKRWQNIHISS